MQDKRRVNMADEVEVKPIETWAVVELMGHVKTAGKVSEEPHFGTVLLRLDVPEAKGKPAHTKFYGGASIYRVMPCDEQVARMVLEQTYQAPIVNFALPKPQFGQAHLINDEGDEE
jgi:hypothetical protein